MSRSTTVTQERYKGIAGDKNPYEPEAALDGEPASAAQCNVGTKAKQKKENEGNRAKKLAGTPNPEEQKI